MKTLILIFCFGLLFVSCKKGTVKPNQGNATLIGYDLRLCASPACGGLLITIKNDTAKNPPPFYHINATLEQLGLATQGSNTNPKFPIYVNLSYKPDTGVYGTYHYITVTHIEVAN